jgi:AraC family transcriptional regulator of adaptative response / DNA-3-methyladenine glycosylase II
LALEPTGEIDTVLAALQALPGVGPWTAQYIALRALGWPDAFPHSDAGLLKALGTRDPTQALQRAQIWRPYRGYAAIHLWRHGLPRQ